jgi:hypothetical protein
MACCSRPKIQSSTYSDWCENCGWSYDYVNNEETGTWHHDDDEDDDFRY